MTFMENTSGSRLLRTHHRYTHYRDLPELLGNRSLLEEREALAHIIQYVGSNGEMKCFAQRVLRRQHVPIAYLYLMVRFLVFVDEPHQSRALQALRLALRYKGGDIPPRHRMIQLPQLCHDFLHQAQEWLHGYVRHHKHWFPPYHLPKVQVGTNPLQPPGLVITVGTRPSFRMQLLRPSRQAHTRRPHSRSCSYSTTNSSI